MKHTLNSQDLDGFEAISVLASSTKESKRLEIVSTIDAHGKINSELRVSSNGIIRLTTNNLSHAIEHYNKY